MGKDFQIVLCSDYVCEFRRVAGVPKRGISRLGDDSSWHPCEWFKANGCPIVQLVPPGERWQNAHIYRLQLSAAIRKRWPMQPEYRWIAAMSCDAAASWVDRHYAKIADRQAGLAKCVLTGAMNEISRKTSATPGASRRAVATAPLWFRIREVEQGGGKYALEILDSLPFAGDALKTRDAVNIALKKAANKIAGNLAHNFKDIAGWRPVATPFPEVKRRRKTA